MSTDEPTAPKRVPLGGLAGKATRLERSLLADFGVLQRGVDLAEQAAAIRDGLRAHRCTFDGVGETLPEIECPSCHATIRAKMADEVDARLLAACRALVAVGDDPYVCGPGPLWAEAIEAVSDALKATP